MSDPLLVAVQRGTDGRRVDRFEVPRQPAQTVLDVVTWIQREADPSLAYRFACRVGMCGSCAMTVNGKPRWTCRTRVEKAAPDGRLVLEPLRNMPVVKDLVVDMAPFFAKWTAARGVFAPRDDLGEDFAVVPPASPGRRAADAAIECIGCGVCYSACDVVAWRSDYLGPAALNRAWTLVNDTRDGAARERLTAVASDAGCHACHSHGSCTQHCPKSLSPTASIAGLKRVVLRAALRGEL
ncbi:succinate dehydrogenase/fumarate reductase iron-sulfur subunit [Elioraea sp.]|uniref:succinate dehydrogenase/fumarate reductase iron-sulfur subunit n=1 Tax=Elioraea sp. TaxID=2185103 RepID=UPI003F7004E9